MCGLNTDVVPWSIPSYIQGFFIIKSDNVLFNKINCRRGINTNNKKQDNNTKDQSFLQEMLSIILSSL